MIEEYAVVTERVQSLAKLEIERKTACSLCGQKRGCGNATWGKLLGHKNHTFLAENKINANVGDSVVVAIDEQAALHSVFYLYIVPLVSLFAGAVLADLYFKNDLYVLIASFVGLWLGFLWVKGHLQGFGHTKKPYMKHCQAVVLRFAEDQVATCDSVAEVKLK